MTVNEYLKIVNEKHQSGIAREHSYRAALEGLIKSLAPQVQVTNEPANVTDCGNPDYVITKGKIPIGYIEAKDVGKNLKDKQYKEQFSRYKEALDNLIITDYLWFRFFVKKELVCEIRIAEIVNGKIKPLTQNFAEFEDRIRNFCSFVGETIKSSKKLAGMMAAKARLLQIILKNAVTSDEKTEENTSLKGQYRTFKDVLIHDLNPNEFADIYAQTLAYGMFAARLNDPTPKTFSRQEAAELIPKTNPFLRKLFQHVAGPDIDDRIKPTVDNLAEVFRATDVKALLKNFGSATQQNDPVIHFYETFLGQYDAKLRKARGVWYTPEPVVNFIVRAVDDILKTEFRVKEGLADRSKIKIDVKVPTSDGRSKSGYKTAQKEVHKVQILDPATGTGTFLAEVIKHIYNKRFKNKQGAWSSYVETHLIPRLNGFELLMASYAMAHLKLGMLLEETKFKPKKNQRFRVYLTNSLEKEHPDTGTLFAHWLSSEANEANHIKRETPVMCVLGNPPYNGESKNKGDWIMGLMDSYKKEPGGKEKLKERNPKWINDDYVKFLRYAQHFIEKNNEGVLAFINPHGFLDNPTFRGMRWHLLKTYDKIYTIDLHGNAKKKEKCPDGSKDDNVFDIQQGVSINILVKTGKKKPSALGEVYHFDLYGKRAKKYDFLWENSIESIKFKLLPNKPPMYFMIPRDYKTEAQYNKGIALKDLFPLNGTGIVSKRDPVAFSFDKEKAIEIVTNIHKLSHSEIKSKYDNVNWESRDGKVEFCKKNVMDFGLGEDLFVQCHYRPFDKRWTYYTGTSKGFLGWPVDRVMKHFMGGENLGLVVGRQGQVVGSMPWNLIFITDSMTDFNLYYRGGGVTFPLYTSPNNKAEDLFAQKEREPNLNMKQVGTIAKKLKLPFTKNKPTNRSSFAPVDLLDYVYAILHSPTYRNKYKTFLKNDFPKIPLPKNAETFWKLVSLGKELRITHLLISDKDQGNMASYPVDGNNKVTRKMTKTSIGFETSKESSLLGRVWINDEQHFANVPRSAWEFYIGGYQPAQKWLKDRKGKTLDFDDIEHYQKIIIALSETSRIMKEIDKIDFE